MISTILIKILVLTAIFTFFKIKKRKRRKKVFKLIKKFRIKAFIVLLLTTSLKGTYEYKHTIIYLVTIRAFKYFVFCHYCHVVCK